MNSQIIENNSPVMRTAISNMTADGRQSFRTSLFGFNKVAVNDYIDRLYSEFSVEEERLNRELSRCTEDKNEAQGKVGRLEGQLNDLQAKVSYELSFIKSFHDREESYRNNISQLSNTIGVLADKLKTAGEINATLNTRLLEAATQRSNAEQELNSTRLNMDGLNTTVLAHSRDNEGLAAENKKLEAEKKELTESVEILRKTILSKDEELSTKLDALADKEAAISALNSRVIEKEVSNRRVQQELTETQQRLMSTEQSYIASQTKVHELEKQLEDHRNSENELKGQMADQTKSATNAEQEYLQQILSMQQELDILNTRNTELQSSLNQKVTQVKELTAKYAEAVADTKKKDSTISDLRNEISDFSRKQMDYEFKVNSLSGDVMRHQITLSQRDNTILMLRQQISALEAKVNHSENILGRTTSSPVTGNTSATGTYPSSTGYVRRNPVIGVAFGGGYNRGTR